VLSVKRPVTSKVRAFFLAFLLGYWSTITKLRIPKKLKAQTKGVMRKVQWERLEGARRKL